MTDPNDRPRPWVLQISAGSPAELVEGTSRVISLLEAMPERFKNRRDVLGALLEMDRLLQPGVAEWDLLELDRDEPEADRTAAADRLAAEHFTKGKVFFPDRWPPGGDLDRAFREWKQQQGGDWRKAWALLVQGAITVALGGLPDDTPAAKVRQKVLRAAQRAIERDLLGHTTDAGDPAEKLAAKMPEPPAAEEVLANAELRLDLIMALGRLPNDERELLLEYKRCDRGERDGLAERWGISPAALRKRVQRVVDKLRDDLKE